MAKIWVLMKGRAKTGGLLCGIAQTEREQEAWQAGSDKNWAIEVDTATDGVFSEPYNGVRDEDQP